MKILVKTEPKLKHTGLRCSDMFYIFSFWNPLERSIRGSIMFWPGGFHKKRSDCQTQTAGDRWADNVLPGSDQHLLLHYIKRRKFKQLCPVLHLDSWSVGFYFHYVLISAEICIMLINQTSFLVCTHEFKLNYILKENTNKLFPEMKQLGLHFSQATVLYFLCVEAGAQLFTNRSFLWHLWETPQGFLNRWKSMENEKLKESYEDQ